MKYDVIYNKVWNEFKKQVNLYLADGWEPQGGVMWQNNSGYMQAIIKREDNEKKTVPREL